MVPYSYQGIEPLRVAYGTLCRESVTRYVHWYCGKNLLRKHPKTAMVWLGSRKCLGTEIHIVELTAEKSRLL